MRVAIIDDDKEFMLRIQISLQNICKKIGVSPSIDTYSDGKVFAEHIGEYELVLLDIEMPQFSGLDICARINNERKGEFPYVIFVSNKDNLVFNALRLMPYSFIRKNDLDFDLEPRILTLYKRIESEKSVYTIKDGYDDINLEIPDIIYLEKYKNYVLFHTINGIYKERGKIDTKEQELSDLGFVRINVGCIVNIRYVVRISNNQLCLKDHTILSISRPYTKCVRKKCSDWKVI